MDAGQGSGSNNNDGGNNQAKKLRIPTRAEAEARRNQLAANKPTLHFKPKGIANLDSQLPTNATNSTTSLHTTLQINNDTRTSLTLTTPHNQQQQKDSTQRTQNTQSQDVDDDFEFDDDLVLDDDIFDIDNGNPSSANLPNTSKASNNIVPNTTTPPVIPPPFVPKSKSTIVVRPSQKGNPLLQSIRNVPFEFGDIAPDFIVGLTSCVIFLR
ncbi:Excision repair cross-complementation group 1 [Entomortierella beljakovae]|nr:Excision repair cross-complementation group 1 [Entomortierella beljakovae]